MSTCVLCYHVPVRVSADAQLWRRLSRAEHRHILLVAFACLQVQLGEGRWRQGIQREQTSVNHWQGAAPSPRGVHVMYR